MRGWLDGLKSPLRQASDEDLARRLQRDGGGPAMAELMQRWDRRIFRLCYRMVADEHHAEDLVQETFLRIFRYRLTFRHQSSFGTYVRRIAVNVCLDWRRRRKVRHEKSIQESSGDSDMARPELKDEQTPEPMDVLQQCERARAVRVALDELPDTMRAIAVMRHYEKLKLREIAQILEMPLGTVKTTMSRALVRLGESLQAAGHGPPAGSVIHIDEVSS